jgi:uncharacterized membrane protein
MERIIYSIGAAIAMSLGLYFTAILFVLADKVVPFWILALIGLMVFILTLIYDVLTTEPEPGPPPRDQE